jgi:hypothetical protein
MRVESMKGRRVDRVRLKLLSNGHDKGAVPLPAAAGAEGKTPGGAA